MITISRKKSKQYEWEVLCTVSLYQIKYGSTEEESMTSASFYSPIIIRIALFMILEETSEIWFKISLWTPLDILSVENHYMKNVR